MDDERRSWTPEQERWRGTVDEAIRALRDRVSDIASSREDQGRSIERRFGEQSARMTKMDEDMDQKFEALHMRIRQSDATILEAIGKLNTKVGTMWVIGAGAFVLFSGVAIGVVVWFSTGAN